MLPVPIAACSALNRLILGPHRVVLACAAVSERICAAVPARRIRIKPDDIASEMKALRRLVPKKFGTCLEIASVMQIWLAFHGQDSKVVVGRRIEGSKLRMHAWLEPDGFGRGDWDNGADWSAAAKAQASPPRRRAYGQKAHSAPKGRMPQA